MPRCAGCTSVFHDDSNCIAFTGSGSSTDPLIANPILDPNSENTLTCGPAGLLAIGGGGDAFATVAASNTPAALKDNADFIGDGVADQVAIETALASFLHVILLQGSFVLSADITIPDSRWLDGSGMESTFITFTGGTPALISTAGHDDITVSNLTVNSNGVGGSCLSFPNGSSNCAAFNCSFYQNNTSVNPVVLMGGSQGQFHHNLVSPSGGTVAVRVEGAESLISNNQLYGPVVYSSVVDGLLESNYISGTTGLSGIFISSSSSQIIVTGNLIENSGRHGVELNNTLNCLIVNNIIKNTSGDTVNTYDGIHLNADVDNSTIQANVLMGVNHRYAVRINNATDNDNWITNNRLPTGGTGIISDLGTNSEFTAGNKS